MPNPSANQQSNLPSGEEIWVRRDIDCRGGHFIKRELSVVFNSLSFLVVRPLLIYVLFSFIRTPLQYAFGSKYQFLVFTIALGVPLFLYLRSLRLEYTGWLLSITRSRFCPIWFYAEQLNPERLTIYHLRKPPTVIYLKGSQITKRNNRHIISIHIADTQSNTSALLRSLTPKEYDRFMQYWNAANTPASTQ